MLALAGAQAADVGGKNRDRHHHAGAGIADGGACLARLPVLLAGDRHQSAGRLRDHVEGEVLLERAAGAEPLDLAVDDRRIDGLDRRVAKAEAIDRARSEVLDHHVGASGQALDELQPARVLQVDGGRTLIGIVLQEIDRIDLGRGAADRAPRIARTRVLDLDHVGAEPRQRLSAGWTSLELGQVEDLHAGKAIFSAHMQAPAFLLKAV